jgi:hypothetical protein
LGADMVSSNCLQWPPKRPRPRWPVRVIFSRLLSYLPYAALLDAFDTRLCHQAIELGTGCSFLGRLVSRISAEARDYCVVPKGQGP